MESEYHDLHDFMSSVTKEMADDYNRIQKRVKEDPGTAGDQGEENWAELLRDWLPPIYQVVTKGRILSHTGITSPQVDVLVLKPTYPKKLLKKKIYLAAGVAAAFECKIKLEKQHIDTTTDNAAKIRRNFQNRIGSPYKELNSSMIYGLLAHSHDWRRPKSKPIGTMISYLLQKLAWEDYSLRELARYFVDVEISGLGQGQMRRWQADIYSEQIRNRVVSGLLVSGNDNFWNEWLITFS
jgi:hypothetical protein